MFTTLANVEKFIASIQEGKKRQNKSEELYEEIKNFEFLN